MAAAVSSDAADIGKPARVHAWLLQGLEMLIKEFGYHIAYKRWNDTFTAVPFKPK